MTCFVRPQHICMFLFVNNRSSKFLKITNMPPLASLQFTHLAFCAGTNKSRKNSFPLQVDTLYSVRDIRLQSQTSPQQPGFHFTVRVDKTVPSFGATFHSSQFKVDTSKFPANSIPSKTSLTVPNQLARCMDAKLQTISYQH